MRGATGRRDGRTATPVKRTHTSSSPDEAEALKEAGGAKKRERRGRSRSRGRPRTSISRSCTRDSSREAAVNRISDWLEVGQGGRIFKKPLPPPAAKTSAGAGGRSKTSEERKANEADGADGSSEHLAQEDESAQRSSDVGAVEAQLQAADEARAETPRESEAEPRKEELQDGDGGLTPSDDEAMD